MAFVNRSEKKPTFLLKGLGNNIGPGEYEVEADHQENKFQT